MAGSKWSAAEMADVKVLDWPEFHERHPARSYNSFEVKRRRVPGGSAGRGVGGADVITVSGGIKIPAAPNLPPETAALIDSHTGLRNAFFDLETTFGGERRILTGSFVDDFGNVTYFHLLDNTESVRAMECAGCGGAHLVREIGCKGSEWLDDSVIADRIQRELAPYNVWVGWYSSGFDIPTLAGRNLRWGNEVVDPQMHKDLMYEFTGVKGYFGGRSLENISNVFDSPHRKTPLNKRLWDRADHGDLVAYQIIGEHNIADVLVTRDVFTHVRKRIRKLDRGRS